MSTQIDDIVDELYNKYHGVSRSEINKIVRSMFKLTQEVVSAKGDKIVNWPYLGKVRPTGYRLRYLKNKKDEQITGDIQRMD